jgi:hypothetical protein
MTESAATRAGPSQSRRIGAFEWFHDRGLGNERFGTVLILILIGFLVSGFDSTLITQMLTGAINAIALILVFRETGMAQSGRRLATIIAIGSLSFALMSVFDRDQPSGGVVWLLQAALALVISVAITARILRHRRVGLQTVFGAVCVYVLIGLMFGFIYGALQSILGREVLQVNDGGEVDPLYYSIVTLTTLGFGDITSPEVLVRRITMIEAMFGQIFLATMVARLVSMFGASPDVPDPGTTPAGAAEASGSP